MGRGHYLILFPVIQALARDDYSQFVGHHEQQTALI